MQLVATIIGKGDRLCMQKQSPQTKTLRLPIGRFVTVSIIPENRMPGLLQMDANLVRTAGRWRALQQAVYAIRARERDPCASFLALVANDDVTFTALAVGDEQGCIDQLLAILPITDNEREVTFLHPPLAKALVKFAQRAATLGHHQTARRFAVDAVHQRKFLEIRPCMAQQLDDAEANPAAPMDRDAGRLVDDQHALVFVEDSIEHGGGLLRRRRRAAR